MINVDLSRLNPLEQQIYEKLALHSKNIPDIKINQAAEICSCSSSKISKFVKKLGFSNYKQYSDFLYEKEITQKAASHELIRIKQFIDDFNYVLVDEFIDLMNRHDKIIFLGYGPSYICTQYLEYKLRTCTNKYILALQDEFSVEQVIDNTSLLVIFTTTGSYRSFENIHNIAKAKGCKVLIIVEEYNPSLLANGDKIFWLCKYPQVKHFKPHEKSRTVFFIFIEEVFQRLLTIDQPL